MTDQIHSVTRIKASQQKVFAVLADPGSHAAIDGTGWVRESLDGKQLTETGQVFRVAMYHDNHPEGHYEMANQVRVFDPPRTLAWEPGQEVTGGGELQFGGWTWRYDLKPVGPDETEVTLSYDWSGVHPTIREEFGGFPPFPASHLDNSLTHLADLATK